MQDFMNEAVLIAVVAMIQTVSTAWISREVKKNACGGAACLRSLKKVLKEQVSET
jgi:hypothetical protein